MAKTEAEKRRDEREKIKRKSLVGRSSHDIVACFSHSRVKDAEKLIYRQHTADSGQGGAVLTVKTDVCDNVVELGKEVMDINEGYDYAVAIVDNETGRTTYRPARLYNFEATYSTDFRQLIGEKLAESSILPPAQPAELPRNIYPISTFISDEEMEQLAESALHFMATPKKQLLENGFPEVVGKMMPAAVSSDASLAVPFTMLGCMVHLSAMFAQRSVLKKEFDEIPFPEAFVQKVMADFVTSQFDRGANGRMPARLALSTDEKDKMMAHSLALAITLSPSCSLPITPWQIALKRNSRFIEKMLTGLGCDITQCTVEEAARTESLRAARLLRPPSKNAPTVRKRRR
ncbi:unnamed protein product [Nippostrongylus brasiliensis]|uniref:RNB domain-containing protein n=1 Tax=Nippostrongylus brasiliensis TaxID=27835 RepID=A0A0N4XXS9_NIPBR|nr:unnamed protein product [Nippostrongylus brasiliensis]